MFRRNILPPPSGLKSSSSRYSACCCLNVRLSLKMGAVHFSKTPLNVYHPIAWSLIWEDSTFQIISWFITKVFWDLPLFFQPRFPENPMGDPVMFWLPFSETSVLFQGSQCRICGIQRATGTGVHRELHLLLLITILPCSVVIFLCPKCVISPNS
jgi:hypothetical protein